MFKHNGLPLLILIVGLSLFAHGCTRGSKGSITTCCDTPVAVEENVTNHSTRPLAHFRFDGDAANTGKGIAQFDFKNTRYKNGSLYLNGKYEHGGGKGYRAICTVPEFDYSAFTVAIGFKAENLAESNILMGGTSYRWFGIGSSRVVGPGIVENDAHLTVLMNNSQYRFHLGNAKLEAKQWMVVVCGVDLSVGKLVVYLNGKKVDDEQWPYEGFKFEVVGSPAEQNDKKWTFTDYSNGRAFHGLVDELIIYNGLLSDDEIGNISSQWHDDRPGDP